MAGEPMKRPLFRRSVEVEVEAAGEGIIRLQGRLEDRREGEPLHGLEAEMMLRVADGVILEVKADMPVVPMPECREGLNAVSELEGRTIRPGFSDLVRGKLGSSRGCTHLANLIIAMGHASVQGRAAYVRRNFDEELAQEQLAGHARELGLINSCVCWREDGPIVRRWRERREKRREEG